MKSFLDFLYNKKFILMRNIEKSRDTNKEVDSIKVNEEKIKLMDEIIENYLKSIK